MFIGSINSDMRSVLAGLSPAWRGLPVYVGCSGNCTVERILAPYPDGLYGNDVSLWSCALGAYLTGKECPVSLRDPELGWLSDWLAPGLPTLATLLLCTSCLEYHGRDHPYHTRMWNAYRRRWPEMHQKTLENIQAATEGLTLRGFHAGDVVDFIAAAPTECAVVSFPPTYKAGYERLYKKLHATFTWDEPTYTLFTPERFETLVESMRSKRFWTLSRDEPVAALAEFQVARVQTSLRSRPVHIYSNVPATVLTKPHQTLEDVPWPRLLAPPVPDPLTLSPLTSGQLNTLRSVYLDPAIAPSGPRFTLGVFAGDFLVGAFAFASSFGAKGDWCDVYLLSDFAVDSAIQRLSKLVCAAILSTEVVSLLEQKLCQKVRKIGTTAFTTKPVSMKYRGIFDLHSRAEGKLNYVGTAGRWTLAEALVWWRKTQAKG